MTAAGKKVILGLIDGAIVLVLLGAAPAFAVTVDVSNAWIRSAMKTQVATDAYMDVHTDAVVSLVGAASPWADRVELRPSEDRGERAPAAVPAIELAGNTVLRLAPGGYHLVLVGIGRDIANGERVPIALDFEDSTHAKYRLEVSAEARGNMFPPGPPPPPMMR